MREAPPLLLYASLAFPLAFAGYPLYIFAPDFYATKYGVSLSLLGAILMALRLFDAFLDPFIGQVSDRKRLKIIPSFIISSVILCASLLALFNPMSDNKPLWFGIFMLLATISTSFLTINYVAFGGVWKTDASVSASREGFSLIGILVAVTLPSILPDYTAYCFVLIILLGISLFTFFKWYKLDFRLPINTSSPVSFSLKLFSNKTRKLYLVYFLSLLASSFPAVLVIFFIRDLLKAEHLTGVFLLIYFASGALSMPFWCRISVKFGNEPAWGFGLFLASVTFISAYFLKEGDSVLYALICHTSGFALGSDLALPPAILSENINDENKQSSATTHFAMLAFLSKFALALASFTALSLIDYSGFKPNIANSAASLQAVSLIYAALPVGLKLIAASVLFMKVRPNENR